MALDTFSNLKASITAISGRDDLSNSMDDFITIAEDTLYNNEVEPLRLRSMVSAPTEYTLSGQFLALPANFLAEKKLTIQTGGEPLELKSATDGNLVLRSGTGLPRFYVIGDQFQFDVVPDSGYTVELTYYIKPTPLSSGNPTNDVLTNHPSLYLYGALTALNDFAAEEEKATYYRNKLISAIRGANKAAKKQMLGSSPAIRQRTGQP